MTILRLFDQPEKAWIVAPFRSRQATMLEGVHGRPFTAEAARCRGANECAMRFSLRKEVIQPQVLLRLPCYDFTPIMSHTLEGCSPCGLAHLLLVQPTFVM